MKECDIFGDGVKTYSDPSYIFSVVKTPNPHPRIHAPAKATPLKDKGQIPSVYSKTWSKIWSQTCVTCANGSQTNGKHVKSMSRTRSKTVRCWRHKWRLWPDLYWHVRSGRKRATSITTCWDRSSRLSTRFSTRKFVSRSQTRSSRTKTRPGFRVSTC